MTSEIRTYLEEKAALGEREWLRREPQETHPAILAAVRYVIDIHPSDRTVYDDDVEREVNGLAGDMPPHLHHGHPDRGPLVKQLGHEVYIARKTLRDEESAAEARVAAEDGFMRLDEEDVELVEGGRYIIRLGILYSGYDEPVYGKERPVKAVKDRGRFVFLPKGARTRYFVPSGPALIKPL